MTVGTKGATMKYRELTPNEIEAYSIGYKVGNRKIVITDIEWESENEHKIYRKGYMAGLMDYKRNVSNVSNVEIETSTTSITSTTPIGISIRNGIENKEIGGMGEKEKEPVSKIDFDTQFQAGFQGWTFPPEIRKVATQHWSADEIRNIEKDFSCHEYETETTINDLLKSYPPKPKTTRFVKPTLEEVKAYCKERLNMVDAEKFVNYYESNGWKVGKNPMKDWKAAIRTWEKSTNTQQQSNILHLSARERQDLINKQKTAALLKSLEKKGN